MKKTVLLLLLLCATFTVNAITVKLKITYYNVPVTDCDITIKHGDVSLGTGRTNAEGDVEIEVAILANNAIDVYGHKDLPDGEKTWDVKGYVKLDENNFYHLQMETFVQKMAKATRLSEATVATMWGLPAATAPVTPAAPAENNSGTENSSGGTDSSGTDGGGWWPTPQQKR